MARLIHVGRPPAAPGNQFSVSSGPQARPAIDVALVTDRAFLPWCATAILSCSRATDDATLHFHVLLAKDVSNVERDQLASAGTAFGADVTFAVADEAAVAGLPSKGEALGGRMSWIRVILADALPDVERVVYLDADTLVLQSLLDLSNSLDGAPIAAVSNVTEPAMFGHLRSLGLSDPADYFNAGVLVINLDQWRKADVTNELVRFATSRPLPWFDQDALNVVFAGRWKRLHPRWNAMNSLWGWSDYARRVFDDEALASAKRDPAILHFEGPAVVKPWHFLSQHPFRGPYRDTLDQTAWAGEPLLERNAMTRAIARLPEHWQLSAYWRWKRAAEKIGLWQQRVTRGLGR